MGTDFSYEDFLEPQYFWPEQTIVSTAVFEGRDCYVLKSTPGATNRTHYAEITTWLDRPINYPVHAERVPKDGKAVKEFTYLGLTRKSGVWAARQIEVKMRGRAGSTFPIFEHGSTKANLGMRDFRAGEISHSKVSRDSILLILCGAMHHCRSTAASRSGAAKTIRVLFPMALSAAITHKGFGFRVEDFPKRKSGASHHGIGKRAVARAPSPSSRFTSWISPPCARAICCASARPTPLPFCLVV